MSLVYFRVTFFDTKGWDRKLTLCCEVLRLSQFVWDCTEPLREVSYVNKALGQQAVGMLIPYLENVCLRSNIFGGCVRRHQAI